MMKWNSQYAMELLECNYRCGQGLRHILAIFSILVVRDEWRLKVGPFHLLDGIPAVTPSQIPSVQRVGFNPRTRGVF